MDSQEDPQSKLDLGHIWDSLDVLWVEGENSVSQGGCLYQEAQLTSFQPRVCTGQGKLFHGQH